MTGPRSRLAHSVLALSGAGAAFAIGTVATLEFLSLALPGPRAISRNPLCSVLAP